MITKKIHVQGMANQNDTEMVHHALHEVWGVREVDVSLSRGEAVVTYDEKAATMADFQQAVIDQGFEIYTEDGTTEEKKV
ncbi:MAG: heavy-metal-associated domain-containing protein [Firmicutes bacterium]|uniref:Copper chaperone CopZ n=1 Tax=Melghirimyces thermohalophilus TaxID=1236220 RepID=A0A1G6L4R1_9BACL|nr:heavy-metal-associated domain-containing protein [Melghirimyces thermohalophilus]MDA8353141.1 heavy-metal-associated domain-containing protein [Bacillota bacterium]SDC38157.1 Copper chaperone CopZ [Melghirimyces thermohalophilus]